MTSSEESVIAKRRIEEMFELLLSVPAWSSSVIAVVDESPPDAPLSSSWRCHDPTTIAYVRPASNTPPSRSRDDRAYTFRTGATDQPVYVRRNHGPGAIMPAKRVHHVGLAVSDVERPLAFYVDLLGPLGWEVIRRYPTYRGTEEVRANPKRGRAQTVRRWHSLRIRRTR
jgi:hypothetical protein